MPVTVRQLADWVGGTIEGADDLRITAAKTLKEAGPDDVTFVEDDKYLPDLAACPAAAVVVGQKSAATGRTLLRVADPLGAFVIIYGKLHTRPSITRTGVHPTAIVHPSAEVAADAVIDAYAVIGEGSVIGPRVRIGNGVSVGDYCRIGEDSIIYPHVVLYPDTILGKRVIIHANAVIGADGFGYRTQQGRHVKVPQLGNVEIGDDVEIGACTTIDRGTFTTTRIGNGTKIDNLVMIGHNCKIGRHNLFVSQVGIAGSVTTGDYVVMAGQVGVAGHVTIGDMVTLGAKAGVHKDTAPNQKLLGAPAKPDRDELRIVLALEKLPDMRRDLQKIKDHLGMKDE